jgi:quercetin dioxygenase-like cupin family protein
MGTFYDNWLDMFDQANAEKKQARKWIHEEEIDWVRTPQDARAGLLVAPENGFRTWGSVSMIAEIPVGWHSGGHTHGEEAIYIVEGSGFSIVNGVRYNWAKGSTLVIPFGAEHQHFNTGAIPARYLSVLAIHLEHLCGLHRTTQLAECGETTGLPDLPVSPDGLDDRHRRIVLPIELAPVRTGGEGDKMPVIEPGKPIVIGTLEGYAEAGIPMGAHKAQIVEFMKCLSRRGVEPVNDFHPFEQEISGILTDAPHEYGGTHAHMEAHLYITAGTGHSIVDGERIDWKKGTCFHVQGPQTVHQHINDSDVPSEMIRIAPGIRYFFEQMARGGTEFPFPYLYLAARQGFDGRERERERERERAR